MTFLAIILENSIDPAAYRTTRSANMTVFSAKCTACNPLATITGRTRLSVIFDRTVNSNADHTSRTHATPAKPPRKLADIFHPFREMATSASVTSKALRMTTPDAITNSASLRHRSQPVTMHRKNRAGVKTFAMCKRVESCVVSVVPPNTRTWKATTVKA